MSVQICNAVASAAAAAATNIQAAAATAVAGQTPRNGTTSSNNNDDETPLGHVFAVLCGALFVIFLPAAYVMTQGKGKKAGAGGGQHEADDDTRAESAALKESRDI
jgi:hypothetical protein